MLAAPGHSISQLEKLAIMWSAKEAVFKWWGWGSVDFSEEILLQPSALSGQGFMAAGFVRNAEVFPLTLQYKLFGRALPGFGLFPSAFMKNRWAAMALIVDGM